MLVYDVWLLCDVSMHRASTQPRLIVLSHAYRVLVCCCVGGWVCRCVVVLWCWCIVLCDASVCRVSTQPKLTVLSRAYWVLVCWCMVVV